MLALVPEDRFDWSPHPKSMTLKQLATHVAEIPSWYAIAVDEDVLDFNEGKYTPEPIDSNADLLALFEKSYQTGKSALERLPENLLDKQWTLRGGEVVSLDTTKARKSDEEGTSVSVVEVSGVAGALKKN